MIQQTEGRGYRPFLGHILMVFDDIYSRDLNILYFCKKYINRLAEPVNYFFTEMENI